MCPVVKTCASSAGGREFNPWLGTKIPHALPGRGGQKKKKPLEKEMAAHSNILAWEIPRIEEPGRIQSMGSQKSQTQLRLNNNPSRLKAKQ